MTRTLTLDASHTAVVDAVDYEWASQVKWRWKHPESRRGTGYARRNTKSKGKQKDQLLHVEIAKVMGLVATETEMVDHINGDSLDNRRSNLRVATATQNQGNRRKQRGKATSSYKGVSFVKARGKWLACIGRRGVVKNLGRYSTEEAAARAYDVAALEYFGEYAHLNFPADPGDAR